MTVGELLAMLEPFDRSLDVWVGFDGDLGTAHLEGAELREDDGDPYVRIVSS